MMIGRESASGKFIQYLAPGSLRFQLLSRSLLIMAFLLAIIGVFQYALMKDFVYRSKAESLESQVKSIPPPFAFVLSGKPPGEDAGPSHVFIPDASIAIIDSEGQLTTVAEGPEGISAPLLDASAYEEARSSPPDQGYRLVNIDGAQQMVIIRPVPGGPGHEGTLIQISTPTGPLDDILIRQSLIFVGLSLLALVAGLLAFVPLLRRTLVPLSNMVHETGQIDAGTLTTRLPVDQGQEEIDRLADSFNSMMDRLEISFQAERETKEQMRRFVADASHELRTPLTSIHGFIEVLLRGAAENPEQLHKSLQSMLDESKRLRNLVQDLLALTRLDSAPPTALQEGCLESVIQPMEAQLRILAGDRQLSIEIQPGLQCAFNVDQIKQVILNLVQNAVQHTAPVVGKIGIIVQKGDEGVELRIIDNGPGIKPEHQARIFDRFYRSDSSRTRKSGGSGLGLAISRSIAEAHGGSIRVESQPGAGCCFVVWLPGQGV